MPDNICPSSFYIRIAHLASTDPSDLFKPDRFRILNYERLTYIEEIIAYTDFPLIVRLLCCHHVKSDPQENYCTLRKNNGANKSICDGAAGNKTQFIHIHIKPEGIECDYLMAFLEGSDFWDNEGTLFSELKETIEWLGIGNDNVFFNIFTFGEPIYKTRNTSYLDDCIDKVQKSLNINPKNKIDYEIKHISNKSNNLIITKVSSDLVFNPSWS